MRSNGGPGANGSGGASGGGIYLACKTLRGTNGVLQANGGAGTVYGGWTGGGGGGGRIAVWRVTDKSNTNSWLIQVNGGGPLAVTGSVGTIYWGQLRVPGAIIYVR